MAANVEAMVREGTNALKAGRKEEARALLMKAVELDELNEDAWLWLSAVVETEEDQQTCLENVLAINPSNERARQGLKYLEQQRRGGAPVLNAMPTATPAPPPVYSAPSPTGDRPPATSTSVEWGAPGDEPSAPAAPQRAPDLSEEDYDNWVSTLNLPTGPKQASAGMIPPGTTDSNTASTSPYPFLDDVTDDSDIDEPDFDLDVRPQSTKSAPTGVAKTAENKAPVPQFGDDFELDPFGEEPSTEKPGMRLPRMPKMALPAMPKRQKAEKPQPELVEIIFEEIPEEIRATRMPGTNEPVSPLVLLLFVLVLGANVALAIMLAQSLLAA